ncbi:MAG: IclR family transcriptional regulator [Actinomycetota bacterium]|nr:IclR family transcriptional regulator [Actinomycetota bacterium]
MTAPATANLVMTRLEPTGLLGKVEAILEVLAEHGATVGLSELARVSGVAKPSVHRICQDLTIWGVVERNGDGFRLGPRLFELGARVPSRRQLLDAALPPMSDLSAASGHTVHLAVGDGDEALYVGKISGGRAIPTPSTTAGRVPMHCSATGKCLLALGSDERRRAVLGGELARRTPRTITDPARLARELDDIVARGWSREHGELVDGFTSIAAPVVGFSGAVVAAVSVTTAVEQMDEPRTVAMVTLTARSIGRRMGGSVGATAAG